ncbi:MAG TPA: hypothetical protein VKB38_19380 [Terracidiphilus sp.]|nr:hypothetical protein [Terracidiphilus sp.]
MNRAYAQRIFFDGRVACVIAAAFLFVCGLVVTRLGGPPEFYRSLPGGVAQASPTEIGFGIINLVSTCLVLVLSVRGLAAEFGRGTLGFLAAAAPSRRGLAFTLWSARALQFASVLLIAYLPFLFTVPLRSVVGAALWSFIYTYVRFAGVELVGLLTGRLWRGIVIVFPGVWMLQITYSILQRFLHWVSPDPITWAFHEWLFQPVLMLADRNIGTAFAVSACWIAACLVLSACCGEWLEHVDIRVRA